MGHRLSLSAQSSMTSMGLDYSGVEYLRVECFVVYGRVIVKTYGQNLKPSSNSQVSTDCQLTTVKCQAIKSQKLLNFH